MILEIPLTPTNTSNKAHLEQIKSIKLGGKKVVIYTSYGREYVTTFKSDADADTYFRGTLQTLNIYSLN